MKPNKTPGALARTEGNNSKTNTSPNTPERSTGLAPAGSETRLSFGAMKKRKWQIKLTPLRFYGENWGWLARTDKYHFCWGVTKQQARQRLLAALNHERE